MLACGAIWRNVTDRRAVTDVLERLAFALEVSGADSREARAFSTAARALREVQGDLGDALASGALAQTRGIGRSSLSVIKDVLSGTEPERLRELEAQLPAGLYEIHAIKGLGPAKVRKLWQGLGVTNVGELEQACRENRLLVLEGFGKKTQENVLAGIEALRKTERCMLRPRAESLLLPLVAALRLRGQHAAPAGDWPRGFELVTRLAIVVAGESEAIDEVMRAHGVVDGRLDGAELEVLRASSGTFGVVEVHATSSDEHWALLVARAHERGLLLHPSELLDAARHRVPCADGDALYRALGLVPTAVERREAGVPLANEGQALPKLVELADLRGALHNHTTLSDGTASLEEMRSAARARGLSYLGISDHSVSAHYARGLSAASLSAQAAAIGRDECSDCVLLSGVESDIRQDGALDYDDEILAQLDVVVASVHRRFSMDREATTQRMLAAAKNPWTDVVGHPTGRLLLGRPPNEFDMDAFLDTCAASGCAVELNASPHRLDLSAEHVQAAVARGILVSIGADAHATGELDNLRHGIAIARRAGLRAEQVLNTRTLPELRAWLHARRARHARA
jgi:DNA polymerase (family X)